MKKQSTKHPKLIKVCAWCPKKDYPKLEVNQEYTHGMCLKHYRQLSMHKEIPFELYISSFCQMTSTVLSKKKRTMIKYLQSFRRFLHYRYY